MKDKILKWMMTGRVGASSKHMAATACGFKGDRSYPYDPDDLNRCILLVDSVPEIKEKFGLIYASSPRWAAIISHWDELVALFHEEVGPDWSKGTRAPRTYKRMKDLLK